MKSYELTSEQIETLSPEEKEKYKKAISYCYEENAGGPLGGWADGHRMLKEMGWKEVKTPSKYVPHRVFVTLEKPERFK